MKKLIEILETSNLFLTGGGGVGKSYATKEIIEHYRNFNKGVICLGSTGISAVNIGGVTLHSFLCLGICKNFDELKEYDRSRTIKEKLKKLNEILRMTDLIIIDEISMISCDVFELVYYRLSSLNYNGRIMVVGDFYQLPPITKKDNQNSNLFYKKYAFSSFAWDNFKFTNVEFKKSKRTKDLKFYYFLNKIRTQDINSSVYKYFSKFIKTKLMPDFEKTVLFGRNKEADDLNKTMLSKINSKLEKYYGHYEFFDPEIEENDHKISKWLSNLNVLNIFEFKIGAKVIFTINKYKNANNLNSFFNGEQGEIIDIEKENDEIIYIKIKKLNEDIIKVEPQAYDFGEFITHENELKYKIIASFYQFPLRLAYGITIHKSQSMSIENLSCDLNNIFADGQLYVALSRAIDPKKFEIIYNRKENFYSYLNKVIKANQEVREFYNNQTFIYLD
ncbi:AAA family ATPase [Campylobacter sp. FMV-PI01]|uniref:AAA family ATPase n=1 Tax=Campylobacter portucalensis TaxID=2608384 RepID=A0A6L5WJU2_9BACT|nr:AAA family ATPase [Campylobacter portucalensis]MSN96295.1 AAA family ATPase [Campylobacter portucalensis]